MLTAELLFSGIDLNCRSILAKIAEFFDPCGFFEPIKIQMKLQMLGLKGKGQDESLDNNEQDIWKETLRGFVNLPDIKIPRFCLPSYLISSSKIILICLVDGGKFGGGVAIYAGNDLSPGNWS